MEKKHFEGMGFRGVSEVPLYSGQKKGKSQRQMQNIRGSMMVFWVHRNILVEETERINSTVQEVKNIMKLCLT